MIPDALVVALNMQVALDARNLRSRVDTHAR
jgi:hypothetical protein